MDVYVTEEEQIEAIKNLWRRYGHWLLTIVLAIAVGVSAWMWWQKRNLAVITQASHVYMQMQTSASNDNKAGIQAMANRLLASYAKTPYAAHAALMLAKLSVADKKWQQAIQHLEWVEQHADDVRLQHLAMLRHGRILLAKQQGEQALALLDSINDDTFKPIIEILRGDIYQQQHKLTQARAAYQAAMKSLPDDQTAKALVQMKLDNLSQQTPSQQKGATA